ncbi:MAG: putative transglutaminase/protease [Herbinix sp.]|nr:putative transglutaminase/protease [Herbinix sp.]
MKKIMYLLVLSLLLSCMTSAATAQASTKTPFLSKSAVTLKVGDAYHLDIYRSNGQGNTTSKYSCKSDNEKVVKALGGRDEDVYKPGAYFKALKAGKATITVKYGKTTFKCRVTVTSNTDTVTISEEDAKADLSNIITESMTDFDKIKAVHDFMIRNIEYNPKAARNDFFNTVKYNAAGGYIVDRTISKGYANDFLVYMNVLGIDCKYISNDNHEWNLVKLDGKWYHIDLSWDDPSMDINYLGYNTDWQNRDGSDLKYTYFLISSEELQANDKGNKHSFDSSKYPNCTSTKYDKYDETKTKCTVIYPEGYDKGILFEYEESLEDTESNITEETEGTSNTTSTNSNYKKWVLTERFIEYYENGIAVAMPAMYNITYEEFANQYGTKFYYFVNVYGKSFEEHIRTVGKTSQVELERRVYKWMYGG